MAIQLSKMTFLGTAVLIASVFPSVAHATISISGPLTVSQFDALNGAGAKYGAPSNATFTEPGPIIVGSGTPSPLTGGPDASNADTILLVLSTPDPSALGSKTIGLTFGRLPTIDFSASDFYSTHATDFPSSIRSITNGAVNGIKFPTSDHAGADINFGGLLTKNVFLGNVTITSPISLRVDVFGDNKGLIVGNAANSGAEGITGAGGIAATPEPSTLWLVGPFFLGLIGWARFRKQEQVTFVE